MAEEETTIEPGEEVVEESTETSEIPEGIFPEGTTQEDLDNILGPAEDAEPVEEELTDTQKALNDAISAKNAIIAERQAAKKQAADLQRQLDEYRAREAKAEEERRAALEETETESERAVRLAEENLEATKRLEAERKAEKEYDEFRQTATTVIQQKMAQEESFATANPDYQPFMEAVNQHVAEHFQRTEGLTPEQAQNRATQAELSVTLAAHEAGADVVVAPFENAKAAFPELYKAVQEKLGGTTNQENDPRTPPQQKPKRETKSLSTATSSPPSGDGAVNEEILNNQKKLGAVAFNDEEWQKLVEGQ